MSYEDYILKARRAQAAAAAQQSASFADYRRQYEVLRNQAMGAGAGTRGPLVTDQGWQRETHYERIMKAQLLQQEIMMREAERQRELASAIAYVAHQAYMLREALINDLMGRR